MFTDRIRFVFLRMLDREGLLDVIPYKITFLSKKIKTLCFYYNIDVVNFKIISLLKLKFRAKTPTSKWEIVLLG